MYKILNKIRFLLISAVILNSIISTKAFAAVENNVNKLSLLDMSTNFISNFYVSYKKIIIIVGVLIIISLLDAFYCFVVKAKEQGKFLKELDLEREKYSIVVEQLNDIIFDFDLTEKKIISSSKFEETFGWTLDIQNYNKNFLHEFKIHDDDKILINKIIDDMKCLNKQSIIKQIRLKKSDGKYLWCELKLNYIQRKNKIVRVIGKITDIDNIVRELSHLKLKSENDQLTSIYNKAAFYEKVKYYIEHYKDYNCVLVFIDLDNFKSINDNLGHMVGDEVLKDTANKISDIFNNTDAIISRFGGDEFCVFQPNVSTSLIEDKIGRLCDNLNSSYIGSNDIKINLSASIGIAFYPRHGRNLESLIKKSDIALYNSKEKGKNQFTIYDKKLEAHF